MKQIVGRNLKEIREANKFTQAQVAGFLGIERGTFSNYELGAREVPFDILQKLSDLYGVEFASFFEENPEVLRESLVCSFRVDNLDTDDMETVSAFKDIVKSYLKMCAIEARP